MPLEDLIVQRTAVSDKAWTAGALYDLHKQNRLVFNTEYQRSKVWPKPKQQLLIDSMLRMYDISMIFLRQKDDGTYECLDGQQRLRSIFEFIDGNYPIVPSFTSEAEDEIFYSALPEGLRSRIREFIIHSVIVHGTDDATTSDIFLRLQEGMPLNSPEKLNAMPGQMRKRVIELSQHPFFDGIGLANTRFAYRYLAAQILALSISELFVSLKFPTLKRYYRMYKEVDVPRSALERVEGALNLLNRTLGSHKAAVKFRADIVSLYTLAATLREDYSITNIEPNLKRFLLEFLVQVSTDFNEPYSLYSRLRSSSADSGPNVEERHRIILAKCLQYSPNLRPKDQTRLFNYPERLAIYFRANGKCELCGKATRFDEGEADHKTRHADGGPTIIENGRWLCRECHSTRAGQATASQ